MKAEEEKEEEEVDLLDNNVHTGSKGTSNITSYPRNISRKRDIHYLFLSKKYFKQEGHPISLQIHEIFPTKRDIQYLFLSKKYFEQDGHRISLSWDIFKTKLWLGIAVALLARKLESFCHFVIYGKKRISDIIEMKSCKICNDYDDYLFINIITLVHYE